MTTARLLAPHLTDGNHRELLEAAHHKSKREVELLVATLHPKPAALTVLRRVNVAATAAGGLEAPTAPGSSPIDVKSLVALDFTPTADERSELPAASKHPQASPDRPRSTMTALSASNYRLQVTLPHGTHDKLRRAQDLLRHTLPTGDVAAIIDRALTVLLADLERRRCAAAAQPREGGTKAAPANRHIPAAVRRAVWQRDQGRCAFVGKSGRCRETSFLEFHHVEPYATGGGATIENIQLRCRAHNLYEAVLFFGDGSDCVRERPASWGSGSACPPPCLP